MKLSTIPNLNDILTVKGSVLTTEGTKIKICVIKDTRFATGKEYDNQPNLKHLSFIGECKDGFEYRFILFNDMKVSKVHKYKRVKSHSN